MEWNMGLSRQPNSPVMTRSIEGVINHHVEPPSRALSTARRSYGRIDGVAHITRSGFTRDRRGPVTAVSLLADAAGLKPVACFQQFAVIGREGAIDFTQGTDLSVTIAGNPIPNLRPLSNRSYIN